ncbi:MAG: hypothetical protein JNM84_22255 [Planctomycetes bacterium]|nr:hypothetical protein [Planctomycetota bacterium]
MNEVAAPPPRSPRFSALASGLALGFVSATAIALAGVAAWSAGLPWFGAGESPALRDLRRRLEEQERRSATPTAPATVAPPSAEVSAEQRIAAGVYEAERQRAERAERAADEARAAVLELREDLARAKAQLEDLQSEIDEHVVARAKLESAHGALLERAVAAEMRERELGGRTGADERLSPAPQVETLLGSSSFMEEIAKNLPPDLLGPPPSAPPAAAEPSADRRAAEERATAEAAALAAKRGSIEELRAQANRLLEMDGYGEMQLVRVGSVADGALCDVALREVGPLGETRRFLAAKELRFEAFPGLRSLRVHLRDGYEQQGSGASEPFAQGASEVTFADVRIDDWKALLFAPGLWHETGAQRSGAVDERYPPAPTLAKLNELFARAKGARRFVLRRLDEVQSGPLWRGIELHQLEVGGGGLQVIYEAESAELWWDPVQKSAELRLEHGFQRRGTQRIPFFEKRARVYLGFEDEQGWDAAVIPFQIVAPSAR